MLEAQRRADRSAGKGKNVSRDYLPERVDHLSACDRRVVFGAMVRLDRDVNQFRHEVVCLAETGMIGRCISS